MRALALLALLALPALAGCAEEAPEPILHVDPPPPVLVAEPVEWEASLGPSMCHNGPVLYSCFSGSLLPGMEGEPTYVHDAKDRSLAGGNLTLDWQPLTPTTNALRATVYVLDGCPDECIVNRTLTSASGVPPLNLKVPARELAEDQSVAVVVQPLALYGTSRVTMQQDVRLTGTLTFVA